MTAPAFNLPSLLDNEDKTSAFKNRVRKNYNHIRKWAKRTQSNCFRIYDRDIKEYPVAIDFYNGRFCVHYFTFTKDSDAPPEDLYQETNDLILSLFNTDTSHIYWRTRIKREKTQQYEKSNSSNSYFTVQEYGIKFKVNLTDYLDTGLFLDHRETRQIVAKACKSKRLLNLFAYTCSFSVHASAQGALSTTSVDMSNTYIAWGKDNFILNNLSLQNNVMIRADYEKFLEDEILSSTKYDVIIIDPPTISRSKKMDKMFDIQIDYIALIQNSLRLLEKDGILFFSTNSRKFHFDGDVFTDCMIEEISKKTLPMDFHDPKIHRCWKMQRKTKGL
ncbi:MAG: class I SAM-dependent methyltransferase [Chlamydiae bacterium]|nr:class I SAM-dependent methyltransferase [Chlamydiota bacterium]